MQDVTIEVTVRRGDWVGKGLVSTDTYGGPYHQGVLVIDSLVPDHSPDPINPVDAAIQGYEIVAASDEAMELLFNAGYRIRGIRLPRH